jgi:hypothetical protein
MELSARGIGELPSTVERVNRLPDAIFFFGKSFAASLFHRRFHVKRTA